MRTRAQNVVGFLTSGSLLWLGSCLPPCLRLRTNLPRPGRARHDDQRRGAGWRVPAVPSQHFPHEASNLRLLICTMDDD